VRALPLIALAAGAAACHSSGTGVLADLRGPQSVVAFMGVGPVNSGNAGNLVPLLAVTATRGDELRIIDPQADLPVPAPAIYAPLAVPTLPRPVHLASASLSDGKADVLVVSSGGSEVQLVATWLGGVNPLAYGVITTWDLAGIAGPGSQIISMVGAAVPGTPASAQPPVWSAQPGVARVIVGFAGGTDGLGGKLVVLDFARSPDGSVALAGAPTVKVLGFDPLALAASPDRIHAYVATSDTITDSAGRQVLGIAEVDVSAADAASWTVRGFDGRGPTIAVAAAILGERKAASTLDFDAPQLRVYAVTGTGPPTGAASSAGGQAGCGFTARINCGVVTFDPAAGGLAADPAPGPSPIGPKVPRQPYRAPLYAPAAALSLAVGLPAATGGSQCTTVPPSTCPVGVNQFGVPQALAVMQLPTFVQWTTAMAAVGTGNGFVYIQDLGRYGPPDTTYLLDNVLTQTQVSSALSVPPASSPDGNYIALYDPPGLGLDPPPGAGLAVLNGDLYNSIIVWPGFTPTDTWTLTWQGVLPGLGLLQGVYGRKATGELYLAIQQPVNPGVPPAGEADWVIGAIVADPWLGIHAGPPAPASPPNGDIVLFFPSADTSTCLSGTLTPGTTLPAYEWTIVKILDPDPVNYPGGALQIEPANSFATCLVQSSVTPAPGGYTPVAGSIRASGLILASASLGYAGRPELGKRFNLAWQPEDALCGAAENCEELVLARKARRLFYPGGPYAPPNYGDPCPGNIACYPGYPEMTDPMQPGPLVGFRPAVICPAGPCPAGALPTRGAVLAFTTLSGMSALSARPPNVSTPTYATSFDKSFFTDSSSQTLGEVFYLTYTGDVLFMAPPVLIGDQKTIR